LMLKLKINLGLKKLLCFILSYLKNDIFNSAGGTWYIMYIMSWITRFKNFQIWSNIPRSKNKLSKLFWTVAFAHLKFPFA
jgi:hypothetical protein